MIYDPIERDPFEGECRSDNASAHSLYRLTLDKYGIILKDHSFHIRIRVTEICVGKYIVTNIGKRRGRTQFLFLYTYTVELNAQAAVGFPLRLLSPTPMMVLVYRCPTFTSILLLL